MARYQVLHVSRYDFKDTTSGNQVQGCKVTALGETETTQRAKGRPVLSFTAPIEIWDKFQTLPAEFELDLVPRQAGNKVTLALKDAHPIQK